LKLFILFSAEVKNAYMFVIPPYAFMALYLGMEVTLLSSLKHVILNTDVKCLSVSLSVILCGLRVI